jgi:hypothetical protein
MPRVVERKSYNGADERIGRLGLSPLWQELEGILTDFKLNVKEERDANGGAHIREEIDRRFDSAGGWRKTQAGGVDWVKCMDRNGTRVCLAVEVQFSGRSDMLIVDVTHLRSEIESGSVDVGVIVVPSNKLGVYLTDRAAKFSDATRAIERAKATDLPLVVMGLEHDGAGSPLPKKRTRQGKLRSR